MDHVKVDLKNCYGIKSLQRDFDFSKTRAYALYAPNGVMKSSLAKTFQDVAANRPSEDRIFKTRKTERHVIDESGAEIDGDRVLVVIPYDQELGITAKTSTLLLDPKMKREYDDLLRATADARTALVAAIKAQSGTKKNPEEEISAAIMQSQTEFDQALIRVKREVEEQKDNLFAAVPYDTIFNDKVMAALNTKDLKSAVRDYMKQYNDLLASSTYFKRGTFDYYNAGQIAKSLTDNGFFDAKHTVNLNSASGNREITNEIELEGVIAEEKDAILSDAKLRKKFDDVAKQLQKNAELRAFCDYIKDEEALLARMANPERLRQDVLKSYLKTNEALYTDWMAKYDAAAARRKVLEKAAKAQQSQWKKVIEIFNDRFVVPFKLEAKNEAEVTLGQTSIIELGFTYIDGQETAELQKSDLLQSLSTGERKAFYILNVIFEIETRIKNKTETLIVVDDIADSFDYQNKYAIIEYLKDISEDGLFKLIIMTHNFDFFRTIESRFVNYKACLIALRGDTGITLTQALGIRNIFTRDWKLAFFKENKKKIACIPFLRNLVEMTVGEKSPVFIKLTSMLHWKGDSDKIRVADIDKIYNDLCQTADKSDNPTDLIYDLIIAQAEDSVANPGGGLENKVVLAIAIRLLAERFMIDRIADPAAVAAIDEKQTAKLIKLYKTKFPGETESIAVLDRVALMTPENIHVNSFMYEPIIDMSDDSLRKLYGRVKILK
ncbi:phage infection protein [Mesorhizobium sp. LMG 17147]|uniref:phage infection protein n=1 Tax=Mesorhizobium sp. LMG 17147 TaxID=2963091 RepID=UPI0020CA1D2E|nr:phage infection protein [Mesorhizobium sp. LMG 17147]MCP9231431.1 phage infection protein [Mesorhizobium sp. LMG 17147]